MVWTVSGGGKKDLMCRRAAGACKRPHRGLSYINVWDFISLLARSFLIPVDEHTTPRSATDTMATVRRILPILWTCSKSSILTSVITLGYGRWQLRDVSNVVVASLEACSAQDDERQSERS